MNMIITVYMQLYIQKTILRLNVHCNNNCYDDDFIDMLNDVSPYFIDIILVIQFLVAI